MIVTCKLSRVVNRGAIGWPIVGGYGLAWNGEPIPRFTQTLSVTLGMFYESLYGWTCPRVFNLPLDMFYESDYG